LREANFAGAIHALCAQEPHDIESGGVQSLYVEVQMPLAKWNETVLAEAPADAVEMVEGNVYFPPGAVRHAYMTPSETTTVCPWKGTASYYHVTVDGKMNRDAAWYYPDPEPAAENIRGRVGFWRGVLVEG
jgi:uncharacterized protein (DUF427 family)